MIERLPTLCTLSPGGRISYSEVVAFHNVIRGECHLKNYLRALTHRFMKEMDMVERILREATAKSKDGRIDQSEFINHSAANSRYSLFTPMEASIIFHFAGRGRSDQRLSLLDFGQLLDPKWMATHEETDTPAVKVTFLQSLAESAYNFVQGG